MVFFTISNYYELMAQIFESETKQFEYVAA